jgi:hypothetical protein
MEGSFCFLHYQGKKKGIEKMFRLAVGDSTYTVRFNHVYGTEKLTLFDFFTNKEGKIYLETTLEDLTCKTNGMNEALSTSIVKFMDENPEEIQCKKISHTICRVSVCKTPEDPKALIDEISSELGVGIANRSKYDNPNKSIGRKVSLRKAVKNLDKDLRSALWKEYNRIHKDPG